MPDATTGYAGPASFGDERNARSFEMERAIARKSTATLVQIVAGPYDAGGNTLAPGTPAPVGYVDVRPLTNQLDGLGNPMPHETIYHCSYHRFQGGLGAIIVDPVVGDIGKFVIADRDTSVVRATNALANPGSLRRYNKADGTYFGMTQGPLNGSQTTPPTSYITFPENGIIIRDKSGNSIALVSDTNTNPPTIAQNPTQSIVFTSAGITISDKNGNSIVMNSSGIFLNGAQVTSAGDVISKPHLISLDQHEHGGVTTGLANTAAPNPNT